MTMKYQNDSLIKITNFNVMPRVTEIQRAIIVSVLLRDDLELLVLKNCFLCALNFIMSV
jgi:hypothetical protein